MMEYKKDLEPILCEIEKMFLEMGTVYTEAVYQNGVKAIFQKHGFIVSSEIPVLYRWNGIELGAGRYDIVASKDGEQILVELKATVNKKCKWSEIRQMKNYLVQNDFKNGIIINFPQIENHDSGIYYYCLLNCSWTDRQIDIKTSLATHCCQVREYTAQEFVKDESDNTITFLHP